MSKKKELKQSGDKFSNVVDKMSSAQMEKHQKELAEKLKPILERAQIEANEVTSKLGITTVLSFNLVLPEDLSE
jgi:tRNA C32,U32 (ribose-2'-O)-methylase TrmJ